MVRRIVYYMYLRYGRPLEAEGQQVKLSLHWILAVRILRLTIRPQVEDRQGTIDGKEDSRVQKDLR